jgi:endonuclease/exonuclease/phosphatase (EEP) superfamily protein YafD
VPAATEVRSSGRGNHLPGCAARFSLATWNARALLAISPAARRKKSKHLFGLIKKFNVVMVQEAHGNRVEMIAALHRLSTTHWICAEGGRDTATGGVMTIIEKAHFPRHVVTKSFVIEGRAISICVSSVVGPPCELHLVNVHDEKLPATSKTRLERHIRGIQLRVSLASHSMNAFVAGDFNFDREGESRLALSRPADVGPPAWRNAFWHIIYEASQNLMLANFLGTTPSQILSVA